MNNFKISVVLLAAAVLLGCAATKEACKGILGVSTKVLEDGRSGAIKKEFNCNLVACHDKIKAILKNNGSYIYRDDLSKNMLALYLSNEDTAPVGIFLTEKNKDITLIEVSSPSTYGKENISKLVFSTLAQELKTETEKGKTDALPAEAINK
ncbi:MAG: hypothetical protein WC723_01455 [Candidatus Omnitrophota bacterium]